MSNQYKNRKYTVIAHKPEWKNWYLDESTKIKSLLNDRIKYTEHVGSTSVPGLAGKPTLDILVIVEDIDQVANHQDAMASLGYEYLGDYIKKGSRLYAKNHEGSRIVNVHFFELGHPHIETMIRLRDYFLSHPKVMKEYSDLKLSLFNKHKHDYASYRKMKDEWMNNLKKQIGLLE